MYIQTYISVGVYPRTQVQRKFFEPKVRDEIEKSRR